jgi:hypothetical protein
MPMPTQDGRFHAEVLEAGVAETGPNNLTTISLRLSLTEMFDGAEWLDVRGYGWEITAYNYVEKKDGSLNERTINSLKESFGWSGADPFWFEGAELPACQATLGWEEWQGQNKLKVKWLNPYDFDPTGGGVPHSDDAVRRRIQARLGAKLRATAGPAAASSSPPARRSWPPPAPAPDPKNTDRIWDEFCEAAAGQGISDEDRLALWYATLKQVCGHDDSQRVTAAQGAEIEAVLKEALALRSKPDLSEPDLSEFDEAAGQRMYRSLAVACGMTAQEAKDAWGALEGPDAQMEALAEMKERAKEDARDLDPEEF